MRTKTLKVEKFLGKIVKGRGSRISIERGTRDGALPSRRTQRRAQAGTRWEAGTLPGTRTESRVCPRTGVDGGRWRGAHPGAKARDRTLPSARAQDRTIPSVRAHDRTQARTRAGDRGRGRVTGGVTRAGTMRRGRGIEMFDMQYSFGERARAKSVGRGRQKRSSIKKTANIDQGDGEIFGQSPAVVQMDSTVTAIELRKTGVAGATKGFAHGIQ